MSDVAIIPAPVTPIVVLGNLEGVDRQTADQITPSAPAQDRPAGLQVLIAQTIQDLAIAQAPQPYLGRTPGTEKVTRMLFAH